jgi:hypothetical protein
VVQSSDGNWWIKIALVVSIYQYEPYYDDDMVAFRVAVYFDSYASTSLPMPNPVPASRVTFLLDKDTTGSNLYDQCTSVEIATTPAGYSQAYGLVQYSSMPSTYDDRASWALKALGFAVGLFNQPVSVAISLIDMAYSFQPTGADYDDADWGETWGRVWWFDPGFDFGNQNPIKQYAFSSIRWIQKRDINPDTYYGIKIGAYIQLHAPNPLGIASIDMPPVYLRIYRYEPGGGGGCPYLYVWNGSDYVVDNNILGMSEVSNGADVEDYYKLEQTLIPTYQSQWFSLYSLKISEFEHEHSYIDKVRLYAVDHDSNVNVAVTPDGQILTYANPHPPISAIDNYGYDWLPFVSTSDNVYYRGFPGDYLLLDFGCIDTSQAAKLILRANLEWKKETCIHVQVLNETGGWIDAAALRTRNRWSTIIVDLSEHLPNPDGTLKMRLYLTGVHKIDFVGLDASPQANITVIQTSAFSAVHSTHGDVTSKLLINDQVYAELIPGEQIKLKFLAPNTTKTFIIYIEGHYQKIQ